MQSPKSNKIYQEIFGSSNGNPEEQALKSLDEYFSKAETRINQKFTQKPEIKRHEFELSIPEEPNLPGDDMLQYLSVNGVLGPIAFLRTFNSLEDGSLYSELNLIKKPCPQEYDLKKGTIKSFLNDSEDELSKNEVYKSPPYSEFQRSYLIKPDEKPESKFLEDRIDYLTHNDRTIAMAIIREDPSEIIFAKSLENY